MLGIIRKAFTLVLAAAMYAALYFAFAYVFNLIPDLKPWEGIGQSITILGRQTAAADIVYFALGLLFFVHGMLGLTAISRQNHSVRDDDTRLPKALLTDGYYSKVRHPMYGTFMLIIAGLLFPLRSLIALGIAALMIFLQSLNGIMEEKNQLSKIFGEEYEDYKRRVRGRYLTGVMKAYFGAAVLLSAAGLFFM